MAPNPSRLVSRASALATATMPDTATITRAGTVVQSNVPIHVMPIKGFENYTQLPSLPRFIRVPAWPVALPLGTDVRMADTLTTNGATYVVTDYQQPRSFQTRVLVTTAITSTPTMPFPVFTNQTATFFRPQGRLTIGPTPVVIERINFRDEQDPLTIGFDFYVAWQSTLTYSDGTHIGANDVIEWAGLPTGRSVLANPVTTYGSIPVAVAVFKEHA